MEVELLLIKIPESELIVLSSDDTGAVLFGVGWDSSRNRLIGLSIAIASPDRRDDLEVKIGFWFWSWVNH